MIPDAGRAFRHGFDWSYGRHEPSPLEPCLDLPFSICDERASQLEVQHGSSLTDEHAGTCHEYEKPLGRSSSPRSSGQRRFACSSGVLQLFFSCRYRAVGGPPSGQDCRLRRRPASRRRIDAPPVDGLDVRRSVSCFGETVRPGARQGQSADVIDAAWTSVQSLTTGCKRARVSCRPGATVARARLGHGHDQSRVAWERRRFVAIGAVPRCRTADQPCDPAARRCRSGARH